MIPRFLIASLLCLMLTGTARAQYDTSIHFNKYAYDELTQHAKIYNKPIMLYFHVDGCGSCIQMERTAFRQKDIYTYINENFLVYNINTQKGEGVEINKKYRIMLNPTILFLNAAGNEIDRLEGYPGMISLYERLHRATDKMKLYDYFKKDYANGRRNPDFLYQYTYALDANGELDSANMKVVHEYLLTQKPQDLLSAKNIGYIYDFMYYDHKVVMDPHTDAFLAMYNNKALFARYFSLREINSRLIFVLYTQLQKSCGNGGGPEFDYLYSMLKTFHGTRDITYVEPDGTISDAISRIDSNQVQVDYSRCLFTH